MGSSYRSDLNAGRMPEEEAKLREAVRIVEEVRKGWWEFVGEDGQVDNAADDGGLIATLGIAVRLIREELPDEKVATPPATPEEKR